MLQRILTIPVLYPVGDIVVAMHDVLMKTILMMYFIFSDQFRFKSITKKSAFLYFLS